MVDGKVSYELRSDDGDTVGLTSDMRVDSGRPHDITLSLDPQEMRLSVTDRDADTEETKTAAIPEGFDLSSLWQGDGLFVGESTTAFHPLCHWGISLICNNTSAGGNGNSFYAGDGFSGRVDFLKIWNRQSAQTYAFGAQLFPYPTRRSKTRMFKHRTENMACVAA